MSGAKRVLIFCIMTTVLPTVLIIIPLYLRHVVFADVLYNVAESDIIEITNGISSIFCSEHNLQMNLSFNAVQLNDTPKINTRRKHIRLKKSMTLPDDTLEYWGFYLLKGATVHLKVCSRYPGSRILLVRGERNLRTCGLMEPNLERIGAIMDEEYNQVKVNFESGHEDKIPNNSSENGPTKNIFDELMLINSGIEDTSDYNQEIYLNTENLRNKPITKLNNNTKINTGTLKKKFSSSKNKSDSGQNSHRHHHKIFNDLHEFIQEQQVDDETNLKENRSKRDVESHLLDTRIEHGGNAINYIQNVSEEASASSFERNLLTCYNGQILLTEGFPPSELCTDVHYLENGDRMETIHNIVSDGYYYYIFYSDNDFISNDIHAIFDVHKPTLKFENVSETKMCINKTECTFPITFWTNEIVIVEVPMKEKTENSVNNFSVLISTCYPRMSVYIIFPISVMFLILGCAFM